MRRSAERLGPIFEVVKTCDFRCNGWAFVDGEKTRDGRRTYNVICSAGLIGGCKGPNKDQLKEIDAAAGKRLRAKRPLPFQRFEIR